MSIIIIMSMIFRDTTLVDVILFGSGIYEYPGHFVNFSARRGVTLSDTDLYMSDYAGLYDRLLMLASDVETNPGPLSESEQTLLKAIQSSERKVLDQINEVKADLSVMKSEIEIVKSECRQTRSDVQAVKAAQQKTDETVISLRKEIKNLRDEKETLQLDIDQLHEDFETKIDIIADMDDELDRLDRESRKATMRIFGLEEEVGEQKEDAKRIVTDKVLKVACAEEDWTPDDLQKAYRVGQRSDDKPRIMIATFRYSDDKYRIYGGRTKLRENGIRVGDDLTKRQRKKLSDLKQRGYNGYFFKGKVHTRKKKIRVQSKSNNANTGEAQLDNLGNDMKRRRIGEKGGSRVPFSQTPMHTFMAHHSETVEMDQYENPHQGNELNAMHDGGINNPSF